MHTLLHGSGLLPAFAAEGRSHVVFFQDTNVLAFKAIPAALGVSVRLNFAMNSLAVPRSPGEAAGAICKLVRPDAPPLVINVEYNRAPRVATEPWMVAGGRPSLDRALQCRRESSLSPSSFPRVHRARAAAGGLRPGGRRPRRDGPIAVPR